MAPITTHSSPKSQPMLRVAQVAHVTGLRIQTIRDLTDAGDIRSSRIGKGVGRHRRYNLDDVLDYCKRAGIRPRHIDL